MDAVTLHQLRAIVTRAKAKAMKCEEKDVNAALVAEETIHLAAALLDVGVEITMGQRRPDAGEEAKPEWGAEVEKAEVS